MRLRNKARWTPPAVLAAAMLVAGPPSSAVVVAGAGNGATAGRALPACTPGAASTHAPTTPAGPAAPGACRASGPILESALRLTQPAQAGFTPVGYHHLGANTSGEWGGVSGRISVVDGSVRPRSYDFVASRFMAKRNLGQGRVAWLEAGWAETGWAGVGAPHVYTFNTNTSTWQFYNQYAIQPGDRLWLDIHGDASGVWGAWLWWNNRWNLLTAQKLPIGSSAFIEQYVEVHVDDGRPARVDVPTVTVDNVQLKPAGGGPSQYWRSDVPTLTGTGPGEQQRSGGFCLDWINLYDTWTAGDCPDGDGGGLLITKPAPLPSGDAEVVRPSATPSSTNPTEADIPGAGRVTSSAPPGTARPAPSAPPPTAGSTTSSPSHPSPSHPSPSHSSRAHSSTLRPTEAPATTPGPAQRAPAPRGLLGRLLG